MVRVRALTPKPSPWIRHCIPTSIKETRDGTPRPWYESSCDTANQVLVNTLFQQC